MQKKSYKLQTKAKQQRTRVNTVHTCVCFRLYRAITFLIGLSLLVIIAYGYPYWIDTSKRHEVPWSYYPYVSTAALEFLTSIFACSAVYYHIRCMVKYSLYWILIHTVYIPILFYLTNLLNAPRYPLAIIWLTFQLILVYLLWKYKQILKEVYDWDDEDEDSQETDVTPSFQHEEEKPITTHNKLNNKDRTVSVSVNVSQPSTFIYHAQQPSVPQIPMVPIPNMSMPQHYHPIPIQQTISEDHVSNERVRTRNESNVSEGSIVSYNNHSIKPKKNPKTGRHYRRIATEELELSEAGSINVGLVNLMDSDDVKVNKSDSDSDSDALYENTSPLCKTTPGTAGYDKVIQPQNTMDRLIAAAAAKPLPEGDSEDDLEKEGDEFDGWIIQTLKQCAPMHGEWNVFWNNFKDNEVTQDTLINLCQNKQMYREEWNRLIPKIGPRIQFQQALEKRLGQQHQPQASETLLGGEHVYPSPF